MPDTTLDRATQARRKALGLSPIPAKANTGVPAQASTGGAPPANAALALSPLALTKPRRDPAIDAARRARADRVMLGAFTALIIAATVFQCFGLPLTLDSNIALIVPVMGIALAVLTWYNPPKVDPTRFLLYVLTLGSAGISTAFFADRYSAASLALFSVLYAPFVLSFEVSEKAWRQCLDMFSTVMVAMVGLEFIQHAMQIVAGPQSWPNLYRLLPASVLIDNFNYLQPLVWGSPYDKPQAFVFLETSFLSQFAALALAVEIMVFRRLWRMALFTAGIFATFAGTGLLLLALTLPVMLGRASLRTTAIVIVVLIVALAVAVESGWLQTVANRFGEFQQNGASANHRFVEPFQRMIDLLDKPSALYSGIGAGQIEKSINFQFWPLAKVAVEYGYLTAGLFLALVLRAMFDRPPSLVLAFTLVVWFSLEGALLTAVNPFLCMMLSSFFVVPRAAKPQKRPAAPA